MAQPNSNHPYTTPRPPDVYPAASMSSLVERLYHVRQRLRELEVVEKELTQTVTSSMRERRLKTIVAAQAEAKLCPCEILTVEPAALEKILPNFLETVK